MKHLILFFATLAIANFAIAQNTEINKSYFVSAKQDIENMLNGKEQPSYEKAIFTIENAFYENGINKNDFDFAMQNHINNINQIISDNYDFNSTNPNPTLLNSKEQLERKYKKALTNWVIYHYMTSNIGFVDSQNTYYHEKYTYSSADPMASNNWANTQVTNLNHTHQGNCFALASLFKILSNRLNSEANLCTAPSHIYISHKDNKGTSFNVELGTKNFPGTGTISTLTHSTTESIKNDIALRELNEIQSVALCLVYLAKGYEHKFNNSSDEFILQCAEKALKYDDHNLNAMLLKAEYLENKLTAQQKSITQLQSQKEFKEYQTLIANLYNLGYREIPLEMKNQLIKGWSRDTITQLANIAYASSEANMTKLLQARQASLSWGLFDETFSNKPTERIGNTLFNTKTKKITSFLKDQNLYNNYNFDPVVFAWNIDPLAHQYPYASPYSCFNNNPIYFNDPTGKSGEAVIDKQSRTITVSMNIKVYGTEASVARASQIAKQVQKAYNDANGSVVVDGVSYKVKFQVNGEYKAWNSLVEMEMETNKDYKNNYIRTEKETDKGDVSYTDKLGGNSGFWSTNQMKKNKTTEEHEIGHGFGLDHPEDINPDGGNDDQVASIDMTVNSYNFTKNEFDVVAPETGLQVDVTKRKVTKDNIKTIFNSSVINDLKKNGKANIGTLSNEYHEKKK